MRAHSYFISSTTLLYQHSIIWGALQKRGCHLDVPEEGRTHPPGKKRGERRVSKRGEKFYGCADVPRASAWIGRRYGLALSDLQTRWKGRVNTNP